MRTDVWDLDATARMALYVVNESGGRFLWLCALPGPHAYMTLRMDAVRDHAGLVRLGVRYMKQS